jgi:hypothetical protein
MNFWIETKTLYVVTAPNMDAASLEQFAYKRIIGWSCDDGSDIFVPWVTNEFGSLDQILEDEAIAIIDFLPPGCTPWESRGMSIRVEAKTFFELLEKTRQPQ